MRQADREGRTRRTGGRARPRNDVCERHESNTSPCAVAITTRVYVNFHPSTGTSASSLVVGRDAPSSSLLQAQPGQCYCETTFAAATRNHQPSLCTSSGRGFHPLRATSHQLASGPHAAAHPPRVQPDAHDTRGLPARREKSKRVLSEPVKRKQRRFTSTPVSIAPSCACRPSSRIGMREQSLPTDRVVVN